MNCNFQETIVWHAVSDFKPGNHREVLICFKDGKVGNGYFLPDGSARFNRFFASRDAEYWADFPKGPRPAPSGDKEKP